MPAHYRTKDVARALAIDPRRFNGYLERGLAPCARPGTGGRRLFNRADIIRIAVLDRLVAVGISPARASSIAAAHYADRGLLVVTADEVRVHPRAELPIPTSAVLLDLDRLAAEVDSQLPALAA